MFIYQTWNHWLVASTHFWMVAEGSLKLWSYHFIIAAGHLSLDVYAVKQGSRNTFLIFGDDAWRTGAGFNRGTKRVAWTGVRYNLS
jgi:hypothetical protein